LGFRLQSGLLLHIRTPELTYNVLQRVPGGRRTVESVHHIGRELFTDSRGKSFLTLNPDIEADSDKKLSVEGLKDKKAKLKEVRETRQQKRLEELRVKNDLKKSEPKLRGVSSVTPQMTEYGTLNLVH
jgi:hypothetical protein